MAKLTLICFTLFALLALALGNPFPKLYNEDLNSRIVGGHPAKKGQFPYQVSLQVSSRHICGGSILNKKWILTAGHCTYRLGEPLTVVVGITDLNNLGSDGKRHEVSEIIVHPEYNPRNIVNDLSLLKLKDSINLSNNVKSINLPTSNLEIENLPITATGWGKLSVSGEIPSKLQYLQSKIYNHSACVKRLGELMFFPPITENHLCSFTKTGEGLCKGDSGGPIVTGNIQVGIVSLGQPCAVGYPDVHTHVWKYVTWIKSHITV